MFNFGISVTLGRDRPPEVPHTLRHHKFLLTRFVAVLCVPEIKTSLAERGMESNAFRLVYVTVLSAIETLAALLEQTIVGPVTYIVPCAAL